MKHQPYIGVSGFMTRAEVQAALGAFPDCGRKLMVGVLVSAKTLRGETNSYPRRYPRPEDIAGIFVDDPRCLNMVHFASDEPPDVETLIRLVDVGGPCCHGVQFNVSWPRPDSILAMRTACYAGKREPRLVFQVNDLTRPVRAWRAIAERYNGVVTDVLLDGSWGRGVTLKPWVVAAAAAAVRAGWRGVGLGVAGGLCAEALPSVARLLRDGVSIDAEGRLRDDAPGGGNLDLGKVRAYLQAAGALLQEGA
ncbi:MAG: hypothetical protein ACTHU0_21705 [Kofleriaceae bacterium]